MIPFPRPPSIQVLPPWTTTLQRADWVEKHIQSDLDPAGSLGADLSAIVISAIADGASLSEPVPLTDRLLCGQGELKSSPSPPASLLG